MTDIDDVKNIDAGLEETESHEAGWAVIPSARSSQTVRRQEITNDLKENSSRSFSSNLDSAVSDNTHVLPVGVCSKIVTRSSLDDVAYGCKKLSTSALLMDSLPHPSKLKKRKQKSSKSLRSARHNQCGFDVGAHVAQLKRKHAEFNWLPSHSRDDITSPSSAVDEEPFPARSIEPQCVPGTPTLGIDDFYEWQSDNSEWPFQLPTFPSSESGVLDLFLDQNRHSMVPSRLFSVPSFAVATRERSQKDQQLLQDKECITDFQNTSLSALRTSLEGEPPRLTPWLNNPHFSPEYPTCFPLPKVQKEE